MIIRVKSKQNILKLVGIVVVLIVLVLSYRSYHYFNQGSVVKQSKDQVIVNESGDFDFLRKKTEDELKEIGFSSDEIEVLYEVNEKQITLNQLLQVLIDEPGSVEAVEMYEHNTLPEEVDPIVHIHAEPVESVYLDDKTLVTKVHYTASLNKPFLFQRQDIFFMLFNSAWNRLFGYTKLHYVSSSGETVEDYVVGEPVIGGSSKSDFRLAFETRKRINGEWFYFTGFSGVHVVEAKSDLVFFSQYYHQRLSGYKVTTLNPYWKPSE